MKKILPPTLILFLFVSIITSIKAQVLDSAYGVNGKQVYRSYFEYYGATDAVLQADGGLLVYGTYNEDPGYYPGAQLRRFTKEGKADMKFGYDGRAGISGYAGPIALQSTQKIIVASEYVDRDAYYHELKLGRYKQNGNVDSSFGYNGLRSIRFDGEVAAPNCMVITPENEIYVGGLFAPVYNSNVRYTILKFTEDGILDSSFMIADSVNRESCNSLNLLPDGSLLAGIVSDTDGQGKYSASLRRYYSNGKMNQHFGINGALKLNNRGSIFNVEKNIRGNYVVLYSDSGVMKFRKFKLKGDFDDTFGTGGVLNTRQKTQTKHLFASDRKGNLLLPGSNLKVFRYTSSGTIDSSFGTNGVVRTNFNKFFEYNEEANEFIKVVADTNSFYATGQHFLYGLNEGSALVAKYNTGKRVAPQSVTAAVNELKVAEPITVKLSPNPVADKLYIQNLPKQAHLYISDVNGRNIKTVKTSSSTVVIDVSALSSGMYFLSINETGKTLKFIKQ